MPIRKEFQASTSLDEFKNFIKSFPSFANNKKIHIERLPDQNDLKIVKGLIEDSNAHFLTIHYQLIDQGGHWKILNIKVIPTTQDATQVLEANNHEVLQPIEDQLNAFKDGDLKQAYEDYTSTEFQKTTSFDAFQEFLNHFPIIISHTNLQFIDVAVTDRSAIVQAKFQNAVLRTVVEYTLLKKKAGWKIRGIQILSQENTPNAIPDFNIQDLLNPIQAQLKAIKSGNLKAAYEDFTAQAFRQSTAFQDFENFIDTHTIFKDYKSVEFYKLSFNNNIGIYNALFKSMDDSNGM